MYLQTLYIVLMWLLMYQADILPVTLVRIFYKTPGK